MMNFKHKKMKKDHKLLILSSAALAGVVAINVLHLVKGMKHKNKGPMHEKLEHFQKCFERLIEHG